MCLHLASTRVVCCVYRSVCAAKVEIRVFVQMHGFACDAILCSLSQLPTCPSISPLLIRCTNNAPGVWHGMWRSTCAQLRLTKKVGPQSAAVYAHPHHFISPHIRVSLSCSACVTIQLSLYCQSCSCLSADIICSLTAPMPLWEMRLLRH